MDQPVERREERRAADGPVVGVWMRDPAAFPKLDAERAESRFGEVRVSLVVGKWLDVAVPPAGEIPETLLAVTPDGRDLASCAEELEHPADVSAAGPATRRPAHLGAVLELHARASGRSVPARAARSA